ncbi:MAG: hypothetical protein ABEJ31_10095 [Haloarculaceae archaeon]
MTAAPADESGPEEAEPTVPDWDDEYLDRVSDRLMYNYDLERDVAAGGRRFDMYGYLRVETQKQLLHPALNYANHESVEHLYVQRAATVTVADLEQLVELGHELADERVEPSEDHYGTEFTFVVVAPEIPDAVREFVDGFRDRTLLKLGYYGHYEVNLAVVAPEREVLVASEKADVSDAFALWRDLDAERPGLLARLLGRLR